MYLSHLSKLNKYIDLLLTYKINDNQNLVEIKVKQNKYSQYLTINDIC